MPLGGIGYPPIGYRGGLPKKNGFWGPVRSTGRLSIRPADEAHRVQMTG